METNSTTLDRSRSPSTFEKLKDGSSPQSSIGSGAGSRRSSRGDSSSDGEVLSKMVDFKHEAEELGKKLTDKFESQFQDIVEKFTTDFGLSKGKSSRYTNEHDANGMKIFTTRESYLTKLLEINHVQTIYNIFVALFFVFFLNTTVSDLLETGNILDFSLLSRGLGNKSVLLWNWIQIQGYVLMLYPIFAASVPSLLSGKKAAWYFWGAVYVAYASYLLYYPIAVIVREAMPPIACMIITCEQVRLLMKVHAFVRVNAGKIFYRAEEINKIKKDDDVDVDVESVEPFELPGFSQYLYFLFIPTLIYRDSYPMTQYIRWNFVVKNFLQVIGCIFYAYFMLARFAVPLFRKTGKEPGNLRTLVLSTFACMLPAVLILLVGFFAVLHSWLNAFAEMTRFGDRMFYRDWWNANSFSSYYRTWNVVVHDWLYAYIYKDLLKLGGDRYRWIAATSVFLISAVVHEYILALTFRFFYPALFLMFGGVGWIFFFLKPRKGNKNPVWNIYLWVSLTMGCGILMTLYSVEWYAKQNCSRSYDSYVDHILPYSFDLRCIVWQWKK